MHVGFSAFFQNLGVDQSDEAVYRHELAMADLAEPLGFDSIWAAEHHFTQYTMCPNVAQFLTYIAGRTKRVKLGAMAYIVPWHDPIRLCEEISVLDHTSGGRAILGFGRGLGRVEFDAFRLDMNESRGRFIEYTEAILEALETGVIEYHGKYLDQPRAAVRPAPFRSFRGRAYAAAVSPESARIMARLQLGVLIIAQKPWETTRSELAMYRDLYKELNATEAPKPIVASFIACHEDESVAKEMMETYIRGYSRSALEHYEFDNAELANIKGYEYYGGLSKNIRKHGIEAFVNFLAELQIYGTPKQVFEKIMDYQSMADSAGQIGVFSYGGMPHEMARANVKLFASEVLPKLKEAKVGEPIGLPQTQAAA
jgi:alkanesulfonate monooxygenase SsuD/methylene tetrahydromethanopterin reductase-like flavin-dependent oxidoreductase (luciferase family)